MATAEQVEALQAQLAQAQQQAAAAEQRAAEAQQQAAQMHAQGAQAAPAPPPIMNGNELAAAFAHAMAAQGIGMRASRGERDENALSGKKVGRAMPLYKGEGGDQYLRFERKFKAWADFNKLTDEDNGGI